MLCVKQKKTKQPFNSESLVVQSVQQNKKKPQGKTEGKVAGLGKRKWSSHKLTGKKFGNWLVLTEAPRASWGGSMWYCSCSCGVNRIVQGAALVSGISRSCGCLKKGRPATHGMFGTHRYMLWKSAKHRAREKGLPFTLKVTDIPDIPKRCPILGIPISRGIYKYGPGSASLDRITPSLGYIVGNVQIISHRANAIKQDATWKEIELVANYMKQYEHNKR